ncbi:MAG: SMC family ATPase [Candidatus Izemoplasmatales bacterium]
MIPVRLQIVGFLSYHNPVDIDFTGFDIACISGSNGAGKSSLLDAITWVLFGEARRHDDAVINQRTQRENKHAKVTLDFEYEDSLYRVQRSKQKDKTTTLDFYINIKDDRWKSLTMSSLRSTEEYIQQTLRLDYETFVNASFFLQGKADMFAQQKPSDRKRILSNILRLDVWEEYKEETTIRRRVSESSLTVCENMLSSINETLGEEYERRTTLNNLIEEQGEAYKLLNANKKILDKQQLIASQYEAEKVRLNKLISEINDLQYSIGEKLGQLEDRKSEQDEYSLLLKHEYETKAGYKEFQEYQGALEDYNAAAVLYHKYSAERDVTLSQIESIRKILQNNIDNLTVRESEVVDLEQHCNILSKQIAGYQDTIITKEEEELKVRTKLEKELQELEAKKLKNETESTQFQKYIDELTTKIETLKESKEATCPTCEKSLNDSEKKHIIHSTEENLLWYANALKEHKTAYAGYVAQIREIEEKLLTAEDKNVTLVMYRKNLDITSEKLRKSQEELEQWQSDGAFILKNLRLELENEEYAQEENKELDKITNKINDLEYDEDSHQLIKLNFEEFKHFQDDVNKLEQAKSALAPIEREVKNLEKTIAKDKEFLEQRKSEGTLIKDKLAEFANNQDFAEIELNYKESQDKVDELLRQIGYAKSQVDMLEELKTKKTVEQTNREKILAKIAQLKILEKAFGKDGIPTLLIEQALPDIEAHANEVLDRLSNGTMQLSFETQRDFKDVNRKDRKETLDIMISSSSEERAYELLSGGEAFRINFAIRLALSHILANRSGARLSTLVIDEGFGSQDAEGRQRLIEAINSVREDFSKILVITHLEELKDAFSTRIEVSKHTNGSQVQVVLA